MNHPIAILIGIAGDFGLCWLSWRYLIRPKLTRFIDSRIDMRFRD